MIIMKTLIAETTFDQKQGFGVSIDVPIVTQFDLLLQRSVFKASHQGNNTI